MLASVGCLLKTFYFLKLTIFLSHITAWKNQNPFVIIGAVTMNFSIRN